MKVSIQLRRYSKTANQSKIYFRVRDGKTDLKAVSSLKIQEEFWDSDRYSYKKSTPTDIVSEEVQDIFNKTVTLILKTLNETYTRDSDNIWLATSISYAENMVKPKSTNSEPAKKKERSEHKQVKRLTDKNEKTMIEYFQIYMDTSKFNNWHFQAQSAVMAKVVRFEAWLRFVHQDDTLNLYLPFFDKEGTEEYLDYIEHEWELRVQNPEHFAQFKLYANYNIRPMSKNSISCSAKRLFMFLNWCVTNGFLRGKAYTNVTLDQEVYGTPFYLTIEERDKIYNYDFTYDARLDYHKHKFMFQCLVGCRNNDLNLLTWDHIVEGNFLEYIPHKNMLHGKTDLVRCPLCDKALDILNELDPTMPYLFIKYCDDSYREDIKTILEIVGINRMVTVLDQNTRKQVQKPLYEVAASHLARRTFIGNLYKRVQDPALISSLTGHAENSKAFSRYRAIDDDLKRSILKIIE